MNPRSKKKRKRDRRGVHHPRTLNFDEVADTLEQKIAQLIQISGQQQQKVDMLQNELIRLKTLRENEKLEQDKKWEELERMMAVHGMIQDLKSFEPDYRTRYRRRTTTSSEDSDSGEEDSDSEGSDAGSDNVRGGVQRSIYPGSSSYQTSLKY